MTGTCKILVVTTTFPLRRGDGQPRFILDLCQSLSQHFKLRVLAPSAPGYAADERMDDIRVHRFRYFPNRFETLAYGRGILGNLQAEPARWLLVPFFLLGMVVALRRELRLFKPEIVHAHWWLPAGVAAVVAIMTTSGNTRLLITCHGSDYFVLGGRFRRLRRWVFEHADLVTMVSPAMREHALLQDLPRDKLRVAPMGVYLNNGFEPPAVPDRRGVLYVGRLAPGKGVDVLLRAWAQAGDDVRAHGLTIIGEGSQSEALTALASELGVADSVGFGGAVTHEALPAHYQRAALLVFPSTAEEGLGLVVIEAMGCGCPVLVSDLPALADVVIDGHTGFLFPQGDHAKLALRLDELMRQPALRSAVAERGREATLSHFDWSVVGENYRTLYDELRQQQDGDVS